MSNPDNATEKKFKLYRCDLCGFVYNERDGLPDEFIEPGTLWEEVPEDWSCPDCSAAKADFVPG